MIFSKAGTLSHPEPKPESGVTDTRLLYVDGDPGFRRLVQERLSGRGYTVEVAAEPEQALSRITAETDAVALAYDLPGHEALRVLGGILALPDPPPVLLICAEADRRMPVAALKAGAADHLVKGGAGFPGSLDAAVRSAVARAKPRRDLYAAALADRAARERFEALAAERECLVREVNHRVGNSLQMVAAFLHIQAAQSGSEETRTALEEANRRMLAVAQVHRRIHEVEESRSVRLDCYLGDLVGDLQGSSDGSQRGGVIRLDIDPVVVDPDRATTLGIIVTELVIGAIKEREPGSTEPIRIVLQALKEPGHHVLAVESPGAPGAAMPPAGMARTVIAAMTSRLGGRLDHQSGAHGGRASLLFRIP